MASAPDGAPFAMSMLGNVLVRAPAMPSIVNRPGPGRTARCRPAAGRSPAAARIGAAIERAGLEEDAIAGLDVGADPDHVDDTGAVGADRAALATAGLVVVGGGGELAGAPRVTAVGGVGEQHGLRPGGAAEADVADVGVAEVRARLGVVGPDLLLVAEQRRVLAGHDDRVHPGVVVTGNRTGDVVGSRNRDGAGTFEALSAREVGRDVRVVQTLAVGPGEIAVLVRDRAEGQLRVAVRDEVVLEVVGQGPDWARRIGHAAGVGGRRLARRRVRLAEAAGRHRGPNSPYMSAGSRSVRSRSRTGHRRSRRPA